MQAPDLQALLLGDAREIAQDEGVVHQGGLGTELADLAGEVLTAPDVLVDVLSTEGLVAQVVFRDEGEEGGRGLGSGALGLLLFGLLAGGCEGDV